MKRIDFLLVLFLIITIFFYSNNLIAEVIKVGGYHFPPFVELDRDNKASGITKQLIHEMNQIQDKYTFVFFLTSPTRRYFDFDQKKFDLIMFEDIRWGWQNKDIAASKVFFKGGEVYITKADPKKDQSYFDHFQDKSIAIIKGYHYRFANFNSDETYLKDHFRVQFSSHHKGNILKVLFGRADISVVTLVYLKHFLFHHPEKKKRLLISEKFDQKYNHTILVRKKASITMKEINTLLTQMDHAGIISRIACGNYDCKTNEGRK